MHTIIYSHGMCGMGRLGLLDRRFVRGLESTGVDTRVNDWARYAHPLRNLRDRGQHARAADQLIAMVDAIRRDDPDRRIALVGHSTGCLVMLDAMAKMDRPIDQAVFMAAAVEPQYDLAPIRRAADRVVNLHSRLDLTVLWLGTTLFGTASGKHRPAAGWSGFTPAAIAEHRVEQIGWRPGWIRYGHPGIHVGYLDPRFAAGFVVPMILRHAAASVGDAPPRSVQSSA